MTKGQRLIRIDCLIYQEMADSLNEVFTELSLPEIFIRSARAVVFREKQSRFFSHRNKLKLEESPINFFSFYLPEAYELKVLSFIADKVDFTIPGRGSVFSTSVTVYRKTPLVFNEAILEDLPEPVVTPLRNLVCLVAIVNRGEGNDLAKALLQTGRALPVITYGTGVGLRDKLGLLRITISAEKEIVQTIVAGHDADANFNRMVEAANLDYPGKGFLYSYPVSAGVLDTRMIRGRAFYLASMEQIVSAIDTMKGHSEWRRDSPLKKMRIFDRHAQWDNLRILSRESAGHEKTRAVMNLGAGGATQCRLRYYDLSDETDRTISHEREINDLVINEETKSRIIEAIDEGEDIMELSPVERISAFRQDTKK
jgi:hypothetical protein